MDAQTLRLAPEAVDNTLHVVLEHISEGVVVTDADWTVIYANPAVEKLTATSREHVINNNFWQVFRDLRGTLLDTPQPGQNKSVIKFSAYFVQQTLWVEVNSFPRDSGGLTICFKDITTFKREAVAERSAIEARTAANANAKFRAFFEQGSQFAWLTTLDGTVIETNRYSVQATGLELREIIGRKFWDWGLWDHLPPVMEVVKQAILAAAAGTRFKRELKYSRDPESERYIDLSITPVTDEHGHTIFIAIVGIDITERRRLDAAFSDMRTRLESMLTAAEVATWTWDAETNQIIADRNLVQLFSIPTEKADSATLAEYYASIHPDDIDRVKALSKKAIAEGHLFEARYRVRMTDGNYRTVIARGRAQYDSNGLAVAFPGVVVDITSQAQVESELELSNQRYSALIELMDEGFCLLEILYDQNHRAHDYR
ncbi:MAG TPA: PAS domain S-box protein, partial [Cellvibrio sp.]|nr:PAS domain S-box protein [Cellvibrio sp.]